SGFHLVSETWSDRGTNPGPARQQAPDKRAALRYVRRRRDSAGSTGAPTGAPMLLSAVFTFTVLAVSPQGSGTPQNPSVLTPAEQKTLHDKLAEYMKAWIDHDNAGTDEQMAETARIAALEKAAKKKAAAKTAFQKAVDTAAKRGDWLRPMTDVQAVFANCFLSDTKQAASRRKYEPKGEKPFWLSVPKNYKADKPCRTVLVLPGQDDNNNWADGQRYFEATWDKSASLADVLFQVLIISKDVDMSSMPNFAKTGAEEQERQRNAELLQSIGVTQREYNIDRSRLVLDVGKGATPYALRAMT